MEYTWPSQKLSMCPTEIIKQGVKHWYTHSLDCVKPLERCARVYTHDRLDRCTWTNLGNIMLSELKQTLKTNTPIFPNIPLPRGISNQPLETEQNGGSQEAWYKAGTPKVWHVDHH